MLKCTYTSWGFEIMKVSQAVALRINEILKEKQMSRYKLENLSGVPKGTIICLMSAKYKGVNLTTLILLIRAMGISVEEFFKSPLFDDENLEN